MIIIARPSGTKNIMRTAEEKEKLVLEFLGGKKTGVMIANENNINRRLLAKWSEKYQTLGIKGLESQTGKKTGGTKGQGPRKPKTEEERLQRKITKLEIEVARLKKGYLVRGVGAQKEYVTTQKENMK